MSSMEAESSKHHSTCSNLSQDFGCEPSSEYTLDPRAHLADCLALSSQAMHDFHAYQLQLMQYEELIDEGLRTAKGPSQTRPEIKYRMGFVQSQEKIVAEEAAVYERRVFSPVVLRFAH